MTETAQQRVDGALDLCFERRPGGKTLLRTRRQTQPLQVVRAFALEDGAALVHLHNVSGGVLGGDQLSLQVEVGPDARAQLTTTGATRVYRGDTHDQPARQRTSVVVREQGLLEYLPDPLIPFAGSRYRQETSVELLEGASLLWWEVIAPGREASGELFAYDLLESSLSIAGGGRELALERVRLEPGARPPGSPARLGGYRYYASFYICQVGRPQQSWLELEAQLAAVAAPYGATDEALWGISSLTAHGLAVKAVAMRSRTLLAGLQAIWLAARPALCGSPGSPPRKIY